MMTDASCRALLPPFFSDGLSHNVRGRGLLLTPPLGTNYPTLFVADVDGLQDNEVDDVKLPHGCCVVASLPPKMLLNHGLRQDAAHPDVDVEQDDAAVGLLLTVAVGEDYIMAHHLVVVAAVQLSLCIWMSASLSSLCFLNLMTNDDLGCGLLMKIEVAVDDADGDAVAEADAAAVVSSRCSVVAVVVAPAIPMMVDVAASAAHLLRKSPDVSKKSL